jgi:hypothetical protein
MTRSDEANIASRIFDRDDGQVLLRIYKPFPDTDTAFDNTPDDPLFRCEYALHFPDEGIRWGNACGCDGVEALLLVIARAQLELRYVMDGSGEERSPPRWLGDEDLGLDVIHF